MATRIRAHDWAATPLGPIENWPMNLRTTVDLMLGGAGAVILLWGPACIQIHNDQWRDLMGDKHPAALGRPSHETFPEIADTMEPLYARVFRGEAVILANTLLPISRHGEVQDAWWTVHYLPIRDESGGVAGIFCTVAETTTSVCAEREREAAATALRESEARFRAFVTASSDVVYRMSPDWSHMCELNGQGFLADTTEPREAWLGDYILAGDRPLVQATFRRAIDGKSLFELEHRVRRADGTIGWTLSRAVPILGAQGEIVEWLGSARDITARKESEAALRESEERLTLALRTLPVGIAIIDAAGEMILANEEMRRFLPSGRIPSRDPERTTQWLGWDADGEIVRPEDYPGARALRGEAVSPGLQMLYRDEGGQETWTEVLSAPLRQEGGPVNGAITVVIDVDRLKRSEETAQASEERLWQFGEASQDILWIRDAASMQWVYLTPAFETIYGLSREEALSGDNYRNWQDLIVPEDRDGAVAAIARVGAGEWVTFEYRIRRPSDGTIRWLRNTDFPITNAAGQVVLIGGVGQDVTAAKSDRERLERSEDRLRIAVAVGRVGLWDWNVLTGTVHWSAEHFLMNGYAVDEIIPSYEAWAMRIHPDDRPDAEEALRRARDGHEEYGSEFRVVQPSGAVCWHHARGRFFYGEDGQAIRMVGAVVDVTERREWDERQQVLIAELQHRTRNLMGVVRSMADKTARASSDLADFRHRFRDRLEALSRVQGLLSRMSDHDRVTFDELIGAELAAMDGTADRVTVDGPAGVRLRSSTVQTLAMALHELATNAMKYGALSQPTGQLAITWRLAREAENDKPWLHIDWRESGVEMPPADAPASGTGQGRELIERALPYQLRARTSYKLGADGAHCTISIPVSASTVEVGEHV